MNVYTLKMVELVSVNIYIALNNPSNHRMMGICSIIIIIYIIIIIIIIIIKKDRQCKAGRGRLTPYQSEDICFVFGIVDFKTCL